MDGNAEFRFDGAITRPVLENYLARAVTYAEGRTSDTLDDDIRMLKNIGAKFIGRAGHEWVPDTDEETLFVREKTVADRILAAIPDAVLQGCVFEFVPPSVETIPIPAWAFEALGMPVEKRNFRYEPMSNPDFRRVYRWGHNGTVPDITQSETQLWFYYRARRYIDCGYEALHMGQVHLYGARDPGYLTFAGILARIRAYAREKARRHMVLCDAHTHGIVIKGQLLFDFHSRPISCLALADQPERLVLIRRGFSLGGVTPSGWFCENLPHILEVDNYGGRALPEKDWHDLARRAATRRWGYDDIAWFAHQDESARNEFLEYAHYHVRLNDPNAWFQFPVRRTLGRAPVQRPDGRTAAFYKANRSGVECPDGFGQEDTIRRLWQEPPPPVHERALPFGIRSTATHLVYPARVVLVGSIQQVLGVPYPEGDTDRSALFHRGHGRYERTFMIPFAGEYRFSVGINGTMTEAYDQGGLRDGPPFVLSCPRNNTLVTIRFDYEKKDLTIRHEPRK